MRTFSRLARLAVLRIRCPSRRSRRSLGAPPASPDADPAVMLHRYPSPLPHASSLVRVLVIPCAPPTADRKRPHAAALGTRQHLETGSTSAHLGLPGARGTHPASPEVRAGLRPRRAVNRSHHRPLDRHEHGLEYVGAEFHPRIPD